MEEGNENPPKDLPKKPDTPDDNKKDQPELVKKPTEPTDDPNNHSIGAAPHMPTPQQPLEPAVSTTPSPPSK